VDDLKRRQILLAVFGAAPVSARSQSNETSLKKATLVTRAQDRYGKRRTIGSHLTDFKVSSADAEGGLFVMENRDTTKGGPPRHLHHREDEWFYVIEGNYIVEVGSDRFELRNGDSLLAPREIPHAYAFVGDTPGRLLIAFAPGKNMEEYFTNRPAAAGFRDDPELYRSYGMELLGPGIKL
jgi:mannose-6-phosphate isomerase-like protein (cupin superfamily)